MMKSVPGGTRWGGGIWMGSRDHARYGLLMLRHGHIDDGTLQLSGPSDRRRAGALPSGAAAEASRST